MRRVIVVGTLGGFRTSRDGLARAKPARARAIVVGTLGGFRTSRDGLARAKPALPRAIVVVAAALVACQSNGAKENGAREKPDTGKRHAVKAPPLQGARFFARGAGGDERALELRKLAVDVTTRPGTVRSRLSMEVACAGEGQSEAIVRLAVPRGAAVTDAFLWVNDKPMRGAFVERQRASGVYTSIVTRRRDPALITWDGPGWIAVSIFPLESNRARRLELEWVEPAAVADGRVQYRVPLVAEADRIVGRASLKVDGRRLSLSSGKDGLVALAPADAHKVFAGRAPGDPFQQIMVPDTSAVGAPHFILVAETSSAMTTSGRRRQRAVLDGLLDELPLEAKVTMLAADWDVSPIVEEAGPSAWPDALARIDTVASAGALNLEGALREAGARARKTGAAAVLFVGRGEDAFGGDAVSGPLADLRDAHVRLSAVEIGPGELPRPLAEAAVETGGQVIAAPAFDESLPELVYALRPRPAHPAVDARGDGEWHVLRTVLGGAVWIGRALGAETTPEADTARAATGSPLADDLAALWDRARLEWRDRDPDDEVAKVLTPVTSLLVLESDADYRRFGIDVPETVDPARTDRQVQRNAGILGALKQTEGARIAPIAGGGPALGNDASQVLGSLTGNQVGEAYGVGGLGLVGTGTAGGGPGEGTIGLGNLGTIGKGGGGGNGSGYGRGAGGLGGKRERFPDVIPGQANVRGNLDKEIIRRIIRRHINEVEYCYQQGLTRKPNLGGRIMAQFTIAASGQVISSLLENSTVGSPAVENCVVQAVRRWEFPKPLDGGIVIVSYPFVLTPRGGSEPMAGAPGMALPPPPPPPPAARPVDDALAMLAKGGGTAQIERIASLLHLRRVSSAEVLAWTFDRRNGGTAARLLVARLLELGKRHHDAVRVLSERAYADGDTIGAEMRRLGAADDAAEVRRLARR